MCTSEFITFAHLENKFEKANCKLVGLSIDGLYSHIAWLRTIKEKIEFNGMKNVEVFSAEMLRHPSGIITSKSFLENPRAANSISRALSVYLMYNAGSLEFAFQKFSSKRFLSHKRFLRNYPNQKNCY